MWSFLKPEPHRPLLSKEKIDPTYIAFMKLSLWGALLCLLGSQLSYTPIFGSLFGQLLYYSIPAEFVNSFFSFFQRPFFAIFRFRGWTNAFPCAILYTAILTVSFRAA